MIVCVLSLGSLWREPKNGKPALWNSTGVLEARGIRPRSNIFGQIRISSVLYQEALGTSGLRGSCWLANPLGEYSGTRQLALQRRAPRGSQPDWYLVCVNEQFVGALDESSWDPAASLIVSFSEWKLRQEVLLLLPPHAWLRGTLGSAVLATGANLAEWKVTRW